MYGHAICNIMKKDHQGENIVRKSSILTRKTCMKNYGHAKVPGVEGKYAVCYILKLRLLTGQPESV